MRLERIIGQAGPPSKYAFCGVELPKFTNGFIVGPTESGKTLLARCFLDTFIAWGGRLRSKLIIHDAHRDWLSVLSGKGVGLEGVLVTNPFLETSTSTWSVAHDYTHPAQALTLAEGLIPVRSESQPYFAQAARAVLATVIQTLQVTSPGTWELNDLVELGLRPHWLVWVLRQVPGQFELVAQHLAAPQQAAGVLGSLQAALSELRPAAAAMSRIPERYSLRQWCEGDSERTTLLLSSDAELQAPVHSLNRLVLETVTRAMLARSDAGPGEVRILTLIDEMPALGKMPGVERALREARKKGMRTLLCSQDVESLVTIYGREGAYGILNQCGAKGFTMPVTGATVDYLRTSAGQSRMPERSSAEGWSAQGASSTTTTSAGWHDVFQASELSNLGRPSRSGGVPVAAVADGVPWRGMVEQSWLKRRLGRRPSDIDSLANRRKPAASARARELRAPDFVRLGLAGAPPEAPPSQLFGVDIAALEVDRN